MIYTIEADNNITTFASPKEAKAAMSEYEQFASAKDLAKLAGNWPANRLAEIWNSLPGVKPVKKFTDRITGANRVWGALRSQLPEVAATDTAETADTAPQAAPVEPKKEKASRHRPRAARKRPQAAPRARARES